MPPQIHVIATTISGSIRDWSKVDQIVPLFKRRGFGETILTTADTHQEARRVAARVVRDGVRVVISAGGSGTFNSVLEGCVDSGVNLKELRLGFLRKGSADLLGKALGISDRVEEAVASLADAIKTRREVPCDVIEAADGSGAAPCRRFAGYGGLEWFGEIPRYTENRWIKYYKGLLGQCFGDLGPFFVGSMLAALARLPRTLFGKRRYWELDLDGAALEKSAWQAAILMNGDLGPDLPFAKSKPLGSGEFHLFTLGDIGMLKLPGQFKAAWSGAVMRSPEKWAFKEFTVRRQLIARTDPGTRFPVNIDGATMVCEGSVRFRIIDQIRLLSGS